MFGVGCELLTERLGVLLVQVDLVLRAASPNRNVSSAAPPSRSSSSAAVIFVAILTSMIARAICTVQIKCHVAITATPPAASHPDASTRQAAWRRKRVSAGGPNGHPVVRLASGRERDVVAVGDDRVVSKGAPRLTGAFADVTAGPGPSTVQAAPFKHCALRGRCGCSRYRAVMHSHALWVAESGHAET